MIIRAFDNDPENISFNQFRITTTIGFAVFHEFAYKGILQTPSEKFALGARQDKTFSSGSD